MQIRNCRLVDEPGRFFDVTVTGEKISAINLSADYVISDTQDQKVIDGKGALLTTSLAEPHAHLDKAFLSERVGNPTGDLMGAINSMEANRHLMTIDDTIARAERAVRLMVSNGVTAIRTHADVTEWNSLDAIEALTEVRNRTRDIVEMQIVALLGWPLSGDLGHANLTLGKKAIEMGADILGGCPHLDVDPVGANIALLRLATELGCALDLHTDEHTDAHRVSLEDLADRVIATKFYHSVTASHCVSLGMQAEDVQQRISEKVAQADFGVVALPHTNLFLQGRENLTAPPRGLTAISKLRMAGVRVAAGADNLQDPFNPLGSGDPLETAALMVLAAHQLPSDAFDAISNTAKSVIGTAESHLKIGDRADLMLIQAESLREAIANRSARSMVMYRGRLTHLTRN